LITSGVVGGGGAGVAAGASAAGAGAVAAGAGVTVAAAAVTGVAAGGAAGGGTGTATGRLASRATGPDTGPLPADPIGRGTALRDPAFWLARDHWPAAGLLGAAVGGGTAAATCIVGVSSGRAGPDGAGGTPCAVPWRGCVSLRVRPLAVVTIGEGTALPLAPEFWPTAARAAAVVTPAGGVIARCFAGVGVPDVGGGVPCACGCGCVGSGCGTPLAGVDDRSARSRASLDSRAAAGDCARADGLIVTAPPGVATRRSGFAGAGCAGAGFAASG
jgi:hypothetical protein